MDLSVRDVARLLEVPENTVYGWVRNDSLPAHRVGEQLRFNRVELQEWATLHRKPISPELFGAAPSGLRAALERGGIFRDVAGATRDEVLAAVAALPGIPDGVDRALLHQLLLAREAQCSTGLGDGIAIPHPRDPLVLGVDEPRALLCLLARPVDFGAPDGRPVRALFLLLTPSVREHLQLLGRLAHALHDRQLRELVLGAAPSETILSRLRALEPPP